MTVSDQKASFTPRTRTIPAELAIVVPTYREAANLEELFRRIAAALPDVAWEVVVVDDDSPDGTATLARRIATRDPRLRVIRRVGRRGLSTACIEGALATAAPYVAVIDADLQHDATRLGPMLTRLKQGDVDVVVATRYADGGSVGDWGAGRQAVSRWAGRLSRLMLRADLSDPMSGFFMARRDVFDDNAARLSGRGFKILLDLFASAETPLRFAEIPYRFGLRQHGESKLDRRVALDFLALLFEKTVGRFVPLRFVLFAAVGGSGIVVHMLVLFLFVRAIPIGFRPAMIVATLAAMVSNFMLNNAVTWSDARLRGAAWWRGLAAFCLLCGIGAAANIGVATALVAQHERWWLAGAAGALIGVVWNYAMATTFVWRTR